MADGFGRIANDRLKSGPALRQKNSTGGIKPKRVQVKVSQTVHHLTPPRKLLHTLLTDIHLPTHGAASITRVLDTEAIGFQPDFACSRNNGNGSPHYLPLPRSNLQNAYWRTALRMRSSTSIWYPCFDRRSAASYSRAVISSAEGANPR